MIEWIVKFNLFRVLDKLYEKRKSGALQVEGIVRDLLRIGDSSIGKSSGSGQSSSATPHSRIEDLIKVLTQYFTYSIVPNSRNGGLIALAAVAIALGPHIHLHLASIVPPILSCFQDHDSRVRYYACESMYNVSKVARAHILRYFNEIFDALTKLSVDVELSVKNGAELLDRLIKDIVCEKGTFSINNPNTNISASNNDLSNTGVPLVPGTVPAPELVAYLPEFLDGLLMYLSDPSVDVRTATLNVLSDFLREVGNVVQVQKQLGVVDVNSFTKTATMFEEKNEVVFSFTKERTEEKSDKIETKEKAGSNSIPYTLGQSVNLDFGKMTKTLCKYVTSKDQETQATSLKWVNAFLGMTNNSSGITMLPFTPLLLASILPTLSHNVPAIKSLAIDANSSLFSFVIDYGKISTGATPTLKKKRF